MDRSIIFILAMNTVVAILWLLVLSRLDAYAGKRDGSLRRLGFFLGGMLSIPLVIVLYFLSDRGPLDALAGNMDETGYWFIREFLITGPVEESAKFAIFFAMAWLTRSVRDPRDGILQAATVGLAFAFIENIKYSMEYGPEVLIYRAFFCVLGHVSYGSIWGFAYSQALSRYGQGESALKLVLRTCFLALVPAAFIHGLSNFLLYSPARPLAGLLDLVGLWAAIGLYWLSSRQSPLRDYPLPEWRQAVQVIKRALDSEPDNPDLQRRCGFYLLHGRQIAAARDCFAAVLRLRPGDHYVRIFHGVCLILLGDDSAEPDIHQALFATTIPWKRIRAAIRRFVPDAAHQERVIQAVFSKPLARMAASRHVKKDWIGSAI